MQRVIVHDLGNITYDVALQIQKEHLDKLVAIKKKNRLRPADSIVVPTHHFIFCEHPPVFTLGRTGDEKHLLLRQSELQQRNIAYRKTNRGGDITFHGPGQIVGYPIFDLEFFFTDVHRYVRYIEEAVIRTLGEFNIKGIRVPDFTGVWIEENTQLPMRKICAIGIHLSRWISMHGFAFNINTELDYFNMIVPCGIPSEDKSVTNLSNEIGQKIEIKEVQEKLIKHFSQLFGFEFSWEKNA
ncbi:MAG: lipoyl(octanoyl) transferase LipB [Saprospiraceae bacterium]|nr:lipoyl(octanoyl) transferase LipB [Saprospiraceae bacterium]